MLHKQASKQARKQASKQAGKQASKQTSLAWTMWIQPYHSLIQFDKTEELFTGQTSYIYCHYTHYSTEKSTLEQGGHWYVSQTNNIARMLQGWTTSH